MIRYYNHNYEECEIDKDFLLKLKAVFEAMSKEYNDHIDTKYSYFTKNTPLTKMYIDLLAGLIYDEKRR